ncbi:MAG: murein biosynthesis integral membrane protein MurJ [Candidatus Nealsonbacteria bacterium RBG_13_42_11]|uniref:Probable lipid II flippase MurJ n=1 Tax=Candidatus Nealsonbacteria bacterium RBG_13_42_11 TaxID=1801663 RepID=A0A1G2DZG8_9BACT|nr:MAG: murein biosynthesis integral membrane protein MurJ [Candidatus Nealsonbacteria bacterium RBG_13_42_11]
MLQKIFHSQTRTITTAALILSVASLISRLLGLIRDRLLASTFGAGSDLDVYFAAFRIPDFIYNILIAGGIVVAFLPLFSEYFLKDKKEAWDFVNNALNVFLFFLVLVSLGISIFAPFLVKIITPGFDPQQISLCVLLTRILFLSPILLGLSSIFSGVLQYFNRFLIYSLAPISYNVGIILGIVFLAPSSGILGVTLGVITGAFLHFFIQFISSFSVGFSYKPLFKILDPKIKKVFSLMIPRTLGVAAPQINLMVVTAIASILPAGALSIFTLANNLQQFPMGLIGIPFAIAAFPALSKAWAAQKKDEFLEKFLSAFRKILYLVIPLSILIFVFRNQIILIYKTGRYGEEAASLTAVSLGLFALGIFATTLIPLILRAFFALKDTKTPTIISIGGMILNVFLCFGLTHILSFPNVFQNFVERIFGLQGINDISVVGLALAFSIDSILQFIFLLIFLFYKLNAKNNNSRIETVN